MKTYFCQLGILVVLSILCATHVTAFKIESRIISGTPAALGQFPWQVILKEDEIDTLKCGGSIISNIWVLTAGHCLYGLTSVMLVFGTITLDNDAINRTSTEFYIHPQYNPSNLNNDIALVKLPQPLEFTNTVQPIGLASSTLASTSLIGTRAIIAGFGVMDDEYLDYSENLLWAQVKIVSNNYCVAIFGNETVQNTNLCAVGDGNTNQSICSGDSGGPMIMQTTGNSFIQIGINSFVSEDMCTEGYPSGYVKITSYLDFISDTTGLVLS